MKLPILLAVVQARGIAHAYNLIGQGMLACGNWTTGSRQALGLYRVLGFLSGVGYKGDNYGDNPLGGLNADTVWTWTDACRRDHPLASISAATAAFDTVHPR